MNDATKHTYTYRCGGCETMVSVTWWDGGGAVGQDPRVECANPMCETDEPPTLVETDEQ